MVPSESRELIFAYDSNLAAEEKDLQKILVLRDQKIIGGMDVEISGNLLKITLPEAMKTGECTTVVNPLGYLSWGIGSGHPQQQRGHLRLCRATSNGIQEMIAFKK